jgi:hypothetical protein
VDATSPLFHGQPENPHSFEMEASKKPVLMVAETTMPTTAATRDQTYELFNSSATSLPIAFFAVRNKVRRWSRDRPPGVKRALSAQRHGTCAAEESYDAAA